MIFVDVSGVMNRLRGFPTSFLSSKCTFSGLVCPESGTPNGKGHVASGHAFIEGDFKGSIFDAENVTLKSNDINLTLDTLIKGCVIGKFEYKDANLRLTGVLDELGVCKDAFVNTTAAYLPAFSTITAADDSVSYSGELKCGVADGQGSLSSDSYSLSGSWKNGLAHGNMTERSNGETFTGDFHEGRRHGEGQLARDEDEYFVTYENGTVTSMCTLREKELQQTRLLLEEALQEKEKISENYEKQLAAKQLELEQTVTAHNTLLLCKICFAKNSTSALVPCGHVCLCSECAEEISAPPRPGVASSSSSSRRGNCPVCRRPFSRLMNVFLT